MKNKLVLASSSPRRNDLLKRVGLEFTVITPKKEEPYSDNENPGQFVLRNSETKANSVKDEINSPCFIISADTVVVVDGQVLGKPSGIEQAREMLRALSGKTHEVITGFIISDSNMKILHSEFVTTAVRIKPLSVSEIEGYIKTGEPFDKAGSYGIQGIGSFMVVGIDGSYTNVVGLPVNQVISALHKHNIINLF